MPGDPGAGITSCQPGANCTGLLQLSQTGPRPRAGQKPGHGACSVFFVLTWPTEGWEAHFPRPGHSLFCSNTASPQCWQVTVEQMPSACHLLAEALGSLAMLCFGEKLPHLQTAWETVNGWRNGNYKADIMSLLWAGGITGEFILSCQRQDLICCQMLRGLGKSPFWCLPCRTGWYRRWPWYCSCHRDVARLVGRARGRGPWLPLREEMIRKYGKGDKLDSCPVLILCVWEAGCVLFSAFSYIKNTKHQVVFWQRSTRKI